LCGESPKFWSRYTLTCDIDICGECCQLRLRHYRQYLRDAIFKMHWTEMIGALERWLGLPLGYVLSPTITNRIKLVAPADSDRLPLESIKAHSF